MANSLISCMQDKIDSEKVKILYSMSYEAINNCLGPNRNEYSKNLKIVEDIAKSVHDIIKERNLLHEWMAWRDSMETMLMDVNDEYNISYELRQISDNLGYDIKTFFDQAEYTIFKNMTTLLVSCDFLTNSTKMEVKDAVCVWEFHKELNSMYDSMKHFELRIKCFLDAIWAVEEM